MTLLKRLLREPLVQFLLLGALLFVYFEWKGGGSGPGSTRISITPGLVEHLASGFARTWQRPPTDVELKGLIDEHVKEEIATREATAMGLDRDDTIIRRRLRQKMEFLVEDAVDQVPPTDAELQAWLEKHPETFRAESRVALRQVYVNPERRGASARGDAEKLLARLRAAGKDAGIDSLGDPSMLPRELPLGPLSEVTRAFGSEFAARVDALPAGGMDRPRRVALRPASRPRLRAGGGRGAGARGRSARRGARARGRAATDAAPGPLREAAREVHGDDRDAEGGEEAGRGGPGEGRLAVRRRALLAAVALALGASAARAHEARPGFLELRETGPGTYSFLWKKPTGGEVEIQIAPAIPEGCRLATPDRQQLTPGAMIVRGTLTCRGRPRGEDDRDRGPRGHDHDVLVRLHHADGRLESHLLRPATPSVTLGRVTTAAERALGYVQLGVQHILLGVDHLLFVLGLLLIVSDRWMLVKTITSFTVAHSITLAIATLGYASAPLPPLNAAIALSILFLGPEIVRTWRGETSFTIRHPWVVAFAFGLLHGFGFASGLTAMGLPKAEIPLALLLFNVGVEIGQVAFVLLVVLLERSFRVLEVRWPRLVEHLPGYAVGSLGAYWTIQRTLMLLGGAR